MNNKNARVFYSSVDQKIYNLIGNPEITQTNFKAAGIVTPTDVSDIQAENVLEMVLGLERPKYNLRNACRIEPMDKLVGEVTKLTKLTAQEKVPALVEAEIGKQTPSTVSFNLWKNVQPVAFSDEAQMQARINIMDRAVQDAAAALANSENSQIATIMEATTSTSAGSNWSTVTSGRSANSPFDDIGTAEDSINGSYGFTPNTMIAHPKVWRAFFSNDFVKGQLKGMERPDLSNSFPVPGLPGMTGISDYALTNTQAIVLDRDNAVILGEGPTVAEEMRDPKIGADYYVIRQWLEPKIAENNAMYELTGLLS